ncbi:MAG TPA: chromosome segregation protein SMC, partial [Methylomirabilota bacterium]|nr:chromosome segregation protein SMC [Methylomirabilota bacterium]
MYLKNLTMLGFKSFADKTSLNFQPGVTAIVGPNGCGKSNVSDAIRWVLGEQSAKALRGGEMADVIFNGTDGRKPLGMAEVSLTIGDVDEEHLKAAGVELGYNEVTITRRVFRDGGSEYFINKTPCRLKDIQQLFMGTGMGRTSYSIMAQGNITQILSSKPEDRRLVFEEAAGITKFKAQKREALRKLEHTDQNLLRVADLIREVKRQIGSLQRQAGKARRYKALATELQHLDTQLARHQFDVLQAEIGERQITAENLRIEIELASESVLRREDEILQLRGKLSELEHEISAAQQRGVELKAQAERHESRVHFNQERLQELEHQNLKALGDIAQADERRQAAEEELAVVAEKLAASQAALEQQRAQLDQRRQALQAIERAVQEQSEALRAAQSEAFAALQQLTHVRNAINALDLEKQGNVVRLEQLSAEKIQVEEERARLETRLVEFAASVEAEKLQAQTQRGTVEQRQTRLREIQAELARVSQELDAVLRQQAEKRSRLAVLEQLQSGHEGFGAGALAALKQTQSVLGTLADRIRVPDQYIAAIETALGHHLQLVLTRHPEAARQIVSDLAAHKKGRASIAALDLLAVTTPPAVETEPDAAAEPLFEPSPFVRAESPAFSAAIRATSVVEADDEVRPLLHRLLGLTRIVPDLAAATEAWRECAGAFDFVTLAGEFLSRHGVYTGGTSNGAHQGAASILARKNQMAELQAGIGQLQEQINEVSRLKGALQGEQSELQAGLQEAQTALRAQEVAIATRQGEFNALQNSRRILEQKLQTVSYELETLAAQEHEGREKRAALTGQLTELGEQERLAQERVAAGTGRLEQLRAERDHANAALTEAKVALAAEEQLCASFASQRTPLEQRIRELTHLTQQRRSECTAMLARKGQFEAEIEDSRRQIERLAGERETNGRQTAALEAQRDALEADILAREEDLREQRRSLADKQQRRSALEVELAQKTMAVQNLRERIQQKYQVNLEDVRSECITITIADEGPPRVQTLSPDEMAAAGVATDWTLVAEQVGALQKRLDEMGPVNLVAIEEYEETEQRHAFLSSQ